MTLKPEISIHPSATVAATALIIGSGRLSIGPYVSVEDRVLLDTGSTPAAHIELAPRSKLKYGAVLRTYGGWLRIGARTSVGEHCVLAGHGGLEIGSAVMVAGHCYLSAAEHIWSGATPIRFQGETARGIAIRDGSWLGARVVVLDGVTVGKNTIVGAGSVVTRSLPPSTVCIGSPCRVVRKRDEEADVKEGNR